MTEQSRSPLSAAIVGCGIIGVTHARAINRVGGIAVDVLVDAIPHAAASLAELIGEERGSAAPATFPDLTSALRGRHVDVVVICTPSGMHVGLAEEALAAGAHVVIEKPLDVTLPRARRIAELAEEAAANGRLVSVISQHRFDPASVVVARAVHDGSFGRITSAVASVAWWRSQSYYDSGQWRGTWELDGGGALMNQGVHTVDLLVWMLGRPIEVFATTARLAHERIEVEDVVAATVRFESGALAVLHASTAAYPGLSARLQVHGSRGSAIIEDDRLEYFHCASPADFDESGSTASNEAARRVDSSEVAGAERDPDAFIIGHARQYEDIVAAIRDRRPPGVTVGDALLALAVVRAVYTSASLGRPIDVDEVLAGSYDDLDVRTEVGA